MTTMTDYFPIGAGATTVGGGNTDNILLVTNRNNSGTGSLRWALERDDARIVRYAPGLSGPIIPLKEIRTGANLTLDGRQPIGDKCWVEGARIRVCSSQNIIRGMLLRPGSNPGGDEPDNRDGISVGFGTTPIRYVMIYGNDIRWSQDEMATIWGDVENCTMMLNFMGEALYQSGHSKDFQNGPDTGHSKGLLNGNKPNFKGSKGCTWAYNIVMVNRYRNMLIKDDSKEIEFINNLIYGWGPQGTEIMHNSTARIQGNVYKPLGPNNPNRYSSAANAIVLSSLRTDARIHLNDNIYINGDPVRMSGTSNTKVVPSSGLFPLTMTPIPASDVYEFLMANAGAYPPGRGSNTQQRDDIIDRSLYEIQNGLGSWYHHPYMAKGAGTTALTNNPNDGTGGYDYVYDYPERPRVIIDGTPVGPDPEPEPTETITLSMVGLNASPLSIPLTPGVLTKIQMRSRSEVGKSLNPSNQIEVTAVVSSAIAAAIAASSADATYIDTSDASAMTANSDGSGGAVLEGERVGRITAALGNVNATQSTELSRPTRYSSNGLIRMNAEFLQLSGMTLSNNMMLSMILQNSTDGDFFLLNNTNGNSYAGWASGNATNSPDGGLGTCTYLVDGENVGTNRKTLRDAINDGDRHVVQIHGLTLAETTELMLLNRTTSTYIGDAGHFVLCDTPNAAGIAAIRDELLAK